MCNDPVRAVALLDSNSYAQAALGWLKSNLLATIKALTDEELKQMARDKRMKGFPRHVTRPLLDAMSKFNLDAESAGPQSVKMTGEDGSIAENQSEPPELIDGTGFEGPSAPNGSIETDHEERWAFLLRCGSWERLRTLSGSRNSNTFARLGTLSRRTKSLSGLGASEDPLARGAV